MPNYEMEIGFHPDMHGNGEKLEKYKQLLSSYNITGLIGHKQKETTTLCIFSEAELTRGDLESFLSDDIPVCSFKKLE
jgi:hypothetical protein